jgi:hypothetical protein
MKSYYLYLILILLLLTSCENPFSPKLNLNAEKQNLISDQKNIDGLFQNWKYAYRFKDTVVYGNLFTDDFNFVYRNHDKGIDLTWDRNQDVLTTFRFFSASNNLELNWNDRINAFGDSTTQQVSRGFTLRVVFSADEVIFIQGRATIQAVRKDTLSQWKIKYWRDESEF